MYWSHYNVTVIAKKQTKRRIDNGCGELRSSSVFLRFLRKFVESEYGIGYQLPISENESFSGVGFLWIKISSFSLFLRWHIKNWPNSNRIKINLFDVLSDDLVRSHFSCKGGKTKQKIAPTKILVFIHIMQKFCFC